MTAPKLDALRCDMDATHEDDDMRYRVCSGCGASIRRPGFCPARVAALAEERDRLKTWFHRRGEHVQALRDQARRDDAACECGPGPSATSRALEEIVALRAEVEALKAAVERERAYVRATVERGKATTDAIYAYLQPFDVPAQDDPPGMVLLRMAQEKDADLASLRSRLAEAEKGTTEALRERDEGYDLLRRCATMAGDDPEFPSWDHDEIPDRVGEVAVRAEQAEAALANVTDERDARDEEIDTAAKALLSAVGREEPDTSLWTAVTDVLAALGIAEKALEYIVRRNYTGAAHVAQKARREIAEAKAGREKA